MKAVRMTSLKKLELVNIAKPEPQAGEVVVKIMAGGICGTDLHIFSKKEAFDHYLGHEITGKVVENNSKAGHIKVGDKVVIDNATNCGVCRFCKNGQPEFCQDMYNLLMEEKISFQEYVAVPARSVYPFKELSYKEAALAEPLTVALEMLETAQVKEGQDIMIFGPGPIGLMAAAVAEHIGVNSIYLTGHSHSVKRFALAQKIGVDSIIEVDNEDVVEFCMNEGLQLDRVLITAPPYTLKDAVEITRFGGIITYIGFSFDGSQNVTLNYNDIHFKKLQIRATHAIPNRFYPEALKLIENNIIKYSDFVLDEYLLKDVQTAFENALNNETIKTMILLK